MSLENEVKFCLKLLSFLDAANSSTIFSPSSILSSLAIIHAGSKGKTAEQIAEIIGKDKNREEILEYYSEFSKRHNLTKDKSVVISETRKRKNSIVEAPNVNIANGFFVSDNIAIMPSYEKLIKDKFNATIQSLDFCKTFDAVTNINSFVADSTNNAIKEILTSDDDISAETSLILINAINFIGFWEEPFEDRKKRKFNSNPPRKIPMMTKCLKVEEDDWNFQSGEEWQCLGIPYKNRKAWLYIVLPKKSDGLLSVIEKIDYTFIKKCTQRKKTGKMTVILPIIEISSSINLDEKLKDMGIKKIFCDTADLSGIFEKGLSQKIEKIIHKSVIKIDEKGTEASAATGFQMNARSAPQPFFAIHPFLFFITSVEGPASAEPKDILFMGTFC